MAACAAKDEEVAGLTFNIVGDFGPLGLSILNQPQCQALEVYDITYTKSDGNLACAIQNTVEYSTQYGDDDKVVMENCCGEAVAQYPDAISEEQLDIFCEVKEVVTEGSDVEWDDGFLFGQGRCIMESGALALIYCDADGVTQLEGAPRDLSGQAIDRKLCCTAYDEDSELNNDFGLTFACEEIAVEEEVVTYDPATDTCRVDQENYVYVDRDGDEEFDEEVDEQYNYSLVEDTDPTGDKCCEKAGEDNDFVTAEAVCDRCEEVEDDEFFTYEAPICTRRFDRTTSCFTTPSEGVVQGLFAQDPTLVNFENCLEEVLDASECCAAKQAGKAGRGLENACADITFEP